MLCGKQPEQAHIRHLLWRANCSFTVTHPSDLTDPPNGSPILKQNPALSEAAKAACLEQHQPVAASNSQVIRADVKAAVSRMSGQAAWKRATSRAQAASMRHSHCEQQVWQL